MSTYEAYLLITAIINEREHGTKHYRSSTGELLRDTQEILKAMRENDLEIQPVCQSCGQPMALVPIGERYCDTCKYKWYRKR